MKKIFLSFRPEFFRPILYGIKKYEYRKRFCKDSVIAYLYLSAPIQELIGIMELGNPIYTDQEIKKHEKNSLVYSRLSRCISNRELFAVPIISLQLYKRPISIKEIKNIDPSFFVPQCYSNIEKYPALFNYLGKQEMYPIEFVNEHDKIYTDNLGMICSEMEQIDEFIRKDNEYTSKKKYSLIKCGYVTKGGKR